MHENCYIFTIIFATIGLTNMSKEFSLKFNVNDDDTIDTNSIKIKLEKPKKRPPKTPPGQDFTIILLMIILGIILIVRFFIPASVENTTEQSPEPEPTNSQNNSTAKSSNSLLVETGNR
ncbi:hypothetical protein [Okeania sp.]|uniref:hypothetical protein n=1 Tax=Okeania sp. TaxID=3100323 RepID=UPI002B4B5842|nr:hypothetical protein [Okeania sp.]